MSPCEYHGPCFTLVSRHTGRLRQLIRAAADDARIRLPMPSQRRNEFGMGAVPFSAGAQSQSPELATIAGGDGVSANQQPSADAVTLKPKRSSFRPWRRKVKLVQPMRVEPKTFFANERTFLHWIQAHARTHAHTRARACVCVRARACTHAHAVCARVQIHVRTHAHARAHCWMQVAFSISIISGGIMGT
jgi:hypothetical protein